MALSILYSNNAGVSYVDIVPLLDENIASGHAIAQYRLLDTVVRGSLLSYLSDNHKSTSKFSASYILTDNCNIYFPAQLETYIDKWKEVSNQDINSNTSNVLLDKQAILIDMMTSNSDDELKWKSHSIVSDIFQTKLGYHLDEDLYYILRRYNIHILRIIGNISEGHIGIRTNLDSIDAYDSYCLGLSDYPDAGIINTGEISLM